MDTLTCCSLTAQTGIDTLTSCSVYVLYFSSHLEPEYLFMLSFEHTHARIHTLHSGSDSVDSILASTAKMANTKAQQVRGCNTFYMVNR